MAVTWQFVLSNLGNISKYHLAQESCFLRVQHQHMSQSFLLIAVPLVVKWHKHFLHTLKKVSLVWCQHMKEWLRHALTVWWFWCCIQLAITDKQFWISKLHLITFVRLGLRIGEDFVVYEKCLNLLIKFILTATAIWLTWNIALALGPSMVSPVMWVDF